MANTTPQKPPAAYGRAYKLTVELKKQKMVLSSSSFQPQSLQFSFRITQYGIQAYYYADIKIYNLNGATEEQIIQEGWKVTVEAGYQTGNYGKIFEGYVFQPIRDRENVVDYTLTLNCINSQFILDSNIVKFTANAGLNPRGQMQQICSQAHTPIALGQVSPNISNVKLPRGKVFFGAPKKYFRQLANGSNAQWYVEGDKVHVSKIADPATSKPLVYSPATGLIGTPQQIDYGVSFRVLLDPRLKISNPPSTVKIDNSLIRQQKAQIGQILSLLDKDGTYKVIGVEHIGDTRGNDWYTDVIGVSALGKVPAQLIQQQDKVFTKSDTTLDVSVEGLSDPPQALQKNSDGQTPTNIN